MNHPRLLAYLLFSAVASAAFSAEASPPMIQAIELLKSHKLPEAQAALEKIAAAEPGNAEPTYYLGQIALMQGDAEAAVRWSEKTVAIGPEKSCYYKVLGDAYGLSVQKVSIFSRLGLCKKGLAALGKAVALDPDNLDARVSRIAFYQHAPGFAGGGMDKAYAEAAEIQKRDLVRGVQIAVNLFVSEQKYTEAFALLDDAVVKKPDSQSLFYDVGRLAAISGQNLDRGEAALKSYLQRTPASGEPSLSDTHWRLGLIYQKKGDKTAARSEYAAALKLRPDFKQAQDALKQLP
jgi:tetratricopeptide (TPR) repeat protein